MAGQRRETQVTIQNFLESHGLKVGIINGDSSSRNQETITRFRKEPPDYRVIVSTEAGSEGVNLQVANVLVNFDLPWNPMIVEQRIGRVQRLGSDHAHVIIYNVTLRGTFEEYIVGRLMEKLQMASHAIGDVESLLQGADTDDDDDDPTTSFEERIRKLVIDALAGKDFEKATSLELQSIEEAQRELEREEKNIDDMLGTMDGKGYVGPRAPKLPPPEHSMSAREFTLGAFRTLGARVTPHPPDLFLVEESGGKEYIRFHEHAEANIKSTLYAAGTNAFQRLVSRIIATGIHSVDDLDRNPAKESEEIARRWAQAFGATTKSIELEAVQRCFSGKALTRVRATVAHDSYERLVEVHCTPSEHHRADGRSMLTPLASTIDKTKLIGVDEERLAEAAAADDGISEFSRFYLERREQETRAAGDDERKRKKLYDEFTPRLEMTLVGLNGQVHREVSVRLRYAFEDDHEYESTVSIVPHRGEVLDAPRLEMCLRTGKSVPVSCLGKCEITGAKALSHLLARSEISSRVAQPEFSETCSLSGKRALGDEVELSAVTGRPVASIYLKTSAMSGKRAEPTHISKCAFTNAEVLQTELAISELSGKRYRMDERMNSVLSGKSGHKSEFIVCHETRQPIGLVEATRCEVTGKLVRPGVLQTCEITHQHVLPSELQRCVATGRKALKRLFVTSSLSNSPVLEEAAIRSAGGNYCLPSEGRLCTWSGGQCHPDDIRVCDLTGLPFHFQFCTTAEKPRFRILVELLDGQKRPADEMAQWAEIEIAVSSLLSNAPCKVESAAISPDEHCLAVCAETKKMLGLIVYFAGAVVCDGSIVGRVVRGKRSKKGWISIT